MNSNNGQEGAVDVRSKSMASCLGTIKALRGQLAQKDQQIASMKQYLKTLLQEKQEFNDSNNTNSNDTKRGEVHCMYQDLFITDLKEDIALHSTQTQLYR